jgi:hypothetical protein
MLTQRMQIQAIANHLAGIKANVRLRDFQEPWKSAYQAVIEASNNPQGALIQAMVGRDDRDSIIGAILAEVPGPLAKTFPSLQEIAADLPDVQWLWPDWIPRGMLSLLGAMPGAGKSYLALALAKAIIDGETWPDGTPVPKPKAPVVYVDAESVPQIHNERAEAWELNRNLLYLIFPPPEDPIFDLTQDRHRDQLIEIVFSTNPELVIIDSLGQSSSRGENSVEDVREVLGFLNGIATDFDCGLLLIHHLRKRNPLQAIDTIDIDDFRGSSHIIAMSRSVMGLSIIQTGPVLDRNGPRRLEVIKANLGRYPDAIGVEFMPLHPKGAWLRYGEVPQPWSEPRELNGQDLCGEWLLETLETNGPLAAKDILTMAEEAGFSRAMIYRARKDLDEQIRDTLGARKIGNKWELVAEDESDEMCEESQSLRVSRGFHESEESHDTTSVRL